MTKYITIFFLAISLSGCTTEFEMKYTPISAVSVVSPEVTKLSESMKDVSKEDSIIAYKQFSGLASYMTYSGKNLDNTLKVFKLIESFQSEYSYTKEKYKSYSDAVALYLDKYKIPKKIVTTVTDGTKEIAREIVILDMQNLANAAKINLELKVNAK